MDNKQNSKQDKKQDKTEDRTLDTAREIKYFTLKDGRTLAYSEFGDMNGIPVFHAHGGPGSRLEGRIFDETAKRRGYRIIVVDRPGMGESTYMEGRKLTDYPSDIAELADNLQIDKFGVTGWSAGGAHTTVCAWKIPERLLFNMTFAGYTNFAEMPGAEKYLRQKMDQKSVSLSKHHPHLFKFFFDLMNVSEKVMPESYYKAIIKELCDSDREIAADLKFKELLMDEEREAFKHGSLGVTTDAAVHYVDWGFSLKEIKMKIHVFHGTEDTLVPVEYGKHIAENVPGCVLHLLVGKGHLFPFKYEYQDLIFDTADEEIERAKSSR